MPFGIFLTGTGEIDQGTEKETGGAVQTRGEIAVGDIMLVEGGDSMHNNSFYYPIPEGGKVLGGDITIGPMPYAEGTNKYPSEVIFNIGKASPEYQYYNLMEIQGFDNGYWGYQDSLFDGSTDVEFDLSITPEGHFTFVLPKNITVTSAKLNVTGLQRSEEYMGWVAQGSTIGEDFGHVVKGMGDMDSLFMGDEILVGSPTFTSGSSSNIGKIVQFYHGAEGRIYFRDYIVGSGTGGHFGTSISERFTLPDGKDYFAVGARRNGSSTEGTVYLYPITTLVQPSPTLTITGEYQLQDFGTWIEVGDVTGDGDIELVIGAPSNNSGEGAVYIYDLDHDGSRFTSTLNFSLNAPSGETSFGRFMSTGDINGDTYGDLAIAGDDKVYIYHGGPAADTTIDMTLDPKLLEKVNTFTSLEFLGNVLSTAGETLAVGCPYVGSGTSGGVVLLYDGGPSYDSTEDKIISSTLLNLQNFGLAVDKGDDMNGDGYSEFAVSAGGYLTTAGGAGIFSRNNLGNIVLIQPFDGQAAGNLYGYSLDLGPDIMNDGYDDLFIGSPKYSNSGLVQIMDWYDITTLPDNTPTISVGDTAAWTYSGNKLTSTVTTDDLSQEFNQQLEMKDVWWRDGYNDYVRISLKITCPTSDPTSGSTIFNLSSFEIEYEYPVLIEDIQVPMNSYISTYEPEEDGTFHVPFKFTSSTPGGLKVYDLPLSLDLPPVIESDPQEVFLMDEDTVSGIIPDLWAVFDDDFTPDEELKFLINRKDDNGSIVQVLLVDNRSIVVDSLDGRDNDNWTGEVKFTISCIDGIGARVRTDEITVHIQPVNDAPGIRTGAFPNTVVVQGKSWEFRNCGYDSEGDPITYDIEGPANMTIDINGTIRWIATNDYVGMNTYTIILSDGMDERRVDYPLEVINENDKPEWVEIPPLYNNIYFGDTFTFQVIARDVDLDDRLTYKLVEGSFPTGAMIDHDDGTISWTPGILFDEPQRFKIKVEDLDGASIKYEFYVNVSLRLSPPSFISHPFTNLKDMKPWEYPIEVNDPNGEYDIELYTAPDGMIYNSFSQKLIWTPYFDQVGQFDVTINLTSFHYLIQQNFTLTVDRSQRSWNLLITGPIDQSKVTDIVNIIGTVNVTPSEVLWLEVKVGKGEWMQVTPEGESFSYSVDTGKYDDGDLEIRIRAWDGYMYSDEEMITMKVANHEGDTSLILVVIMVVGAVLFISLIGLIGFLVVKRQIEKDKEEEKKVKLEEIQRSKEEMDSFLNEQSTLTDDAYQKLVQEEEEVIDFDQVMDDLAHKAEVSRDEVTTTLMGSSDKLAYLPGQEEGMAVDAPEDPVTAPEQEPPEAGDQIDQENGSTEIP